MPDNQKTKLRLEIAHVLFIDIVGYSKLVTDEQSEALHELNQVVRNTETVREAEAAGQLIILPTGDGMALVFTGSVEGPAECALEISQALRAQPSLPVRMGIHSGPVHHVKDANARDNISGVGINIAQRVMDCGDAGHILVSKRFADDLAQHRRWQSYLHELGDVEVKHGVVVSLVNLYAETIGNPAPPARVAAVRPTAPGTVTRKGLSPVALVLLVLAGLALVLAIVSVIFAPAIIRSLDKGRAASQAQPSPTESPSLGDTIKSMVARKLTDELQNKLSAKNNTPAAAAEALAPAPVVPEKSVAVLPFENLSANQENAFFTDGVQGEILTDLAKVADLKVISQTSVMQYRNAEKRNLREIAQALRVSHILEGSVQRAGNRVRVNAQLIDARNDTHIWAETYDRDLADVFAIQSEIAQAIANQLRAKLSPREEVVMHEKPTTDMAAYDLYLQAKEIWRTISTSSGSGGAEKVQQAIPLLEEAVRRDPNFVAALCALVRTHMYLHWIVPDPVAGHVELARNALETAARLAPDSGEVHLSRGLFYYDSNRDYEAALKELALAKQSLPNSAEVPYLAGIVERRQNKWDLSTRHIQEALQLDPRNIQYISELTGSNYYVMRRYADAIKVLDEALTWKRDDFGLGFTRALIYFAWKADLGPWKHLVTSEAAKNADPDDLITARLNLALKQRDYHTAGEILGSSGGNEFDDDGFFTPREFNQGVVARAMGDTAKANRSFQAARERAAAAVRQRPDDPKALIALAQSDAALDRRQDAVGEAERATQLLPVEKDVLNGTQLLVRLTQIYAQTGEIDRALDLLENVIKNPDGSNYGSLKLDYIWDPLRGNPRFEKVVRSLAPKL
jgi:serine/threonine-protein kinase